MYGAYQAGAWKALADVFRPDLIVGTSIGALNGWAIAGGCQPDDLIDRWLNLEPASRYRWKLPGTIFGGVLDSEALQNIVRDIHRSYIPKIDYALVMTDLLTLRPRIVPGNVVTWRHLVATGAIVGIFDQGQHVVPIQITGSPVSVPMTVSFMVLELANALLANLLTKRHSIEWLDLVVAEYRTAKSCTHFEPLEISPSTRCCR